MPLTHFDPICTLPCDLVRPVRLDPAGLLGPTRGQARGPRWTSRAHGWHVREPRPTCVEQRILEQGVRLAPGGAVTGWAALRWHGAAYFDGRAGLDVEMPVPLVMAGAGSLMPGRHTSLSKIQLAPTEHRVVAGLQVTSVQRALFDEVVARRDRLWLAVEAVDMTCAAYLVSLALMDAYVLHRPAWEGVPFVRRVLELASEGSRSPKETWLRLVWLLAACLPAPRCNEPVFDLDGALIGIPDLFDEEAGLVGEYEGEHHDDPCQRRKDSDRETRFRDAGLEYVAFGRGDRVGDAAARLIRARARAKFLPPESRAWTLEQPAWYVARESVDARLARLGLVADRSTW